MAAPPRALLSVYDDYPDDDRIKPVYLQAAGLTYSGYGDRHVLLWWTNDSKSKSESESESKSPDSRSPDSRSPDSRSPDSRSDSNADFDSDSTQVIQIIQLTGGTGCYNYYAPVAQRVPIPIPIPIPIPVPTNTNTTSTSTNTTTTTNIPPPPTTPTHPENLQIPLGNFTRPQRDQILTLANQITYSKKSVTNGCRVWTRELLERMVEMGLITREVFGEVDERVPLVRRRPEI